MLENYCNDENRFTNQPSIVQYHYLGSQNPSQKPFFRNKSYNPQNKSAYQQTKYKEREAKYAQIKVLLCRLIFIRRVMLTMMTLNSKKQRSVQVLEGSS
jgi:hypothetical protein